MKVISAGHVYELESFKKHPENAQTIKFVSRVQLSGSPTGDLNAKHMLATVMDGTTNEEVLTMLIDRFQYLQGIVACAQNAIVIEKLKECLLLMEKRTADRLKRNVEGTNNP